MTSNENRWGATLLRCAVASIFMVHGLTRVSLGGVAGFGGFLGTWGLPAGVAIAWVLTIVEIAGGLALGLGLLVRPLAAWFAVQILTGILMVHGKEGWFVVGAGRNGAEYSALIVACLVAVALTDSLSYRVQLKR